MSAGTQRVVHLLPVRYDDQGLIYRGPGEYEAVCGAVVRYPDAATILFHATCPRCLA